MKKYLVTMGGYEQGKNRHNESFGIHRNYTAEAIRLMESGAKWFDGGLTYYNRDILTEYPRNRVLTEPSMGWAFKPICVKMALKFVNAGDVIMWADSNHVVNYDPQGFINYASARGGIFTWDHWGVTYRLRDWTHLDTFVNMDCAEARYFEAPVMQVNVMAFEKNFQVTQFVDKWLENCMNYDVMIRNDLPNLPGYVDHRHEQSVWSILVEKYHIPYYHRVDPAIEAIVPELDGIAL
jgi:hypothetical protein